jgi:hypothetical protein
MFQTLLVHHQGVHQLLLYNTITYLISLIRRSISPCTGLDRPEGFQEVEGPRFQDTLHMKL